MKVSAPVHRVDGVRLLLACCLLGAPVVAGAFGEERGSDIDSREHVSTHHLYLTRALAVCAGFSTSGNADPFLAPQDAERIAIADQLSDSEILSARHGGKEKNSSETFTNCSAKPYAMPAPESLGCAVGSGTSSIMPVLGKSHITALTPVPKWNPEAGCFTSRFGPYSNDFHFPDADRIAVLRDWAFGNPANGHFPSGKSSNSEVANGKPAPLAGTAHFSFGSYLDSPWNAGCNGTRAEIIDTGQVMPGSIDAFGIYLHALGDFHSHALCLAHWGDRQTPPWPTHTLSSSQTGCAFIDHARELGCPAESAHNSLLTPPPGDDYVRHAEQAALDAYDELLRYGQARGVAPKLAGAQAQRAWLTRHARRFVTGWSYLGGAGERREFANAMATQCALLSGSQPSAPAATAPAAEGITPQAPVPATAPIPADIPRQDGEAACPAAR